MTSKMKLPSDIVPTRQEFQIKGKTYALRPWSLRVDAWIREKYGVETVQFVQSITPTQLGQLVFHLLEDKSDFEAKESQGYDDDGRKVEVLSTGADQILERLSMQEESVLSHAIIRCMGVSQPMYDKVVNKLADKAVKDTKKKMKKSPKS